jgi:hypothetical protein
MSRLLGDVPIEHIEGVIDGMETDDLFEKVEPLVAKLVVGKVRDACVSPRLVSRRAWYRCFEPTYGHDMIDTRRIPTIIALLTL